MSEFSDIPREVTPADLPSGENVLWRGKPDWRHLAIDAFHAPLVALYFTLIGIWHLATTLHDGGTRAEALADASAVVVPCAVALSLVALLAWLSARATVFTLTDRRLVMRYGVALPALINVPLADIDAMKVRRGFGGRGDLAFTLPRTGRLSFHQLWPYTRPWHLFPAAPMLRAVPDAAAVNVIFSAALRAMAERERATTGGGVVSTPQPIMAGEPRPEVGEAAYGRPAPAAA